MICEENTNSVKICPKYLALVPMATHLIFVETQCSTKEFRNCCNRQCNATLLLWGELSRNAVLMCFHSSSGYMNAQQ